MKFQGRDLEGENPWQLFPYSHTGWESDLTGKLNALKKYVEGGGRVMIEITEGARKGTIGELVIPSLDVDELYGARYKSGLGGERRQCKVKEWQLKFDDRKNVIKIDRVSWEYNWKGVLRFNRDATVWDYKTTARPKEELPELFDHFGTPLAVDQVVLFVTGTGTDQYIRMGKITRWSAKGTIWAQTFRTRENHAKPSEVQIQGSVNIIVLNGDLREKAMLAKLSLD